MRVTESLMLRKGVVVYFNTMMPWYLYVEKW